MNSKKNILIFGGSGFIGSNFINTLKDYDTIINYDKLTYASRIFKNYTYKNVYNKNIKFLKKNICKQRDVELVLKKYKPKVIVNFAAETHVDNSIENSQIFIKTNINGIHTILNALKKIYVNNDIKKIKFIHISTDEVYGSILRGKANELSKYNPSSPYSASKASGDLLIKSFSKTYGINYKIIYPTNNYGPYQNYEKFIPKTILSILNNKKMTVYGNGHQQRDWIYVEDLCKALNKIIAKNKTDLKEFCISTEKNTSNINIIRKIINIMYDKKIISNKNINNYVTFVRDRPGHDIRYALSNKRLRKYTNWKPSYSLGIGLDKTINWYLLHNERLFKNVNINKALKRKG